MQQTGDGSSTDESRSPRPHQRPNSMLSRPHTPSSRPASRPLTPAHNTPARSSHNTFSQSHHTHPGAGSTHANYSSLSHNTHYSGSSAHQLPNQRINTAALRLSQQVTLILILCFSHKLPIEIYCIVEILQIAFRNIKGK